MEWIMIDCRKVKVMLDSTDMQKYALDKCSLDYEDARCRKALREILLHVREKSGFDTSADRLLVQVYPSREGGCELFVTRLSDRLNGAEQSTAVQCVTMLALRCVAYRFDSLENMIKAAKVLKSEKYDRTASAWKEENESWFLLLEEKVRSSNRCRKTELSYLSEYALPIIGRAKIACMIEHATCVINDHAVELLCDL